jgi:hypothetical protein
VLDSLLVANDGVVGLLYIHQTVLILLKMRPLKYKASLFSKSDSSSLLMSSSAVSYFLSYMLQMALLSSSDTLFFFLLMASV